MAAAEHRSKDLVGAPPRRSVWRRARRTTLRAARDIRDAWEIRTDGSYRRLAADYELPDGSRRIYCYHIRKTAGTSLHLGFMALGGEDPFEVYRRIAASRLHRTVSGDYAFVAYHRRLLAEGAYFYGRSHRPAADQPLALRTFTVTVLRDPVERVRSYFDYLRVGDPPGIPNPVRNRERQIAAVGFDTFLARVGPERLMAQLAMFSRHLDVSEAVDRIAACSRVLFTEDFAGGLEHLRRDLGLALESRRERVTVQRSSLEPGQVERLRARLEPEYDLLRRLAAGGISMPGQKG